MRPAHYSHAAIYLGDGRVLEADSEGVHFSSLRFWFFAPRDSVQVCRVTAFSNPMSWDTSLETVVREAWGLWLRNYNVWGALGLPLAQALGKNVLSQDDKHFCSEVIASAFFSIGFRFGGKEPNMVSPEDLRLSKGVEQLSMDMLSEEVSESFFKVLGSKDDWDQAAMSLTQVQTIWARSIEELRKIPKEHLNAETIDAVLVKSGLMRIANFEAEQLKNSVGFLQQLKSQIHARQLSIEYASFLRHDMQRVLENMYANENEASEFQLLTKFSARVGRCFVLEAYEEARGAIRKLMISEIQDALRILDGYLTSE
jgi:hypothetical protein